MSTKYAIVKVSGHQYRVSEGDQLEVAKIEAEIGKKVVFPEVLLIVDNDTRLLGTPLVENAKIEAEVISQVKGKKIRVATYKAKSRYRRVKGYRDHLTAVKILRILNREKGLTKTKPVNKQPKK